MLRSALVVIGSPRPRTRDSSYPGRGALEDEMGHDLWIRPTAKNKPIDPLCGHASVVMRTSETKLLNTNMSTTRKRIGASDILLIIEHKASIRNESSNSQRGGGVLRSSQWGAPADGAPLLGGGPPCCSPTAPGGLMQRNPRNRSRWSELSWPGSRCSTPALAPLGERRVPGAPGDVDTRHASFFVFF